MAELNEIYSAFLKNPFVCTDTRTVKAGSIFFALKGDSFNGNKFAEQALASGCSFAVIDEPEYKADERFLLVPDVLTALQQLAKHHRKQFDIPFIAITGTNGKTTTKELIHAVLSKKYNTCSTKGNLNNHIGVPLTLLSVTREHEIAVIEMGANHVGEIAELCAIALPGFGIITNIGKAHLEGFGGIQGVIKAKSELYRFINANGGTLFVNAANQMLADLASGIKQVTYGDVSKTDLNGRFLSSDPFVKLAIGEQQVTTQLIGKYNFENILAAACIGNYFKVTPQQVKEALEGYVPSNNRSQVIQRGGNTILLDAYNANPTSMAAAIENFSQMNAQNKVAILGDMLELGSDGPKEHAAIVGLLNNRSLKCKVILVGSQFSGVENTIGATVFADSESAAAWIKNNPVVNATILVKGSRGIKLEKIAEVL